MKSLILFLVLLSSVSLVQIKNSSLKLNRINKHINSNDESINNGTLEIVISTEVEIESISIDSEFIDISTLKQLKPLTVGVLNVTIKPSVEIRINLSTKALSPIKPPAFQAKITYITIHDRERSIETNADWICNDESAQSYGQSPERLNNIVLIKKAEFIWSDAKEDTKASCSVFTKPN